MIPWLKKRDVAILGGEGAQDAVPPPTGSELGGLALHDFALIMLGIHLFHGVWSLFQSMGWSHPRFNAWRRQIAAGVATLIVVGNVSFPIAVLTKIIEVKS